MKRNKYSIRYTISYDVNKKGFKPNATLNPDQGLCDAFIFVPMLNQKNGSYDELFLSLDGMTETAVSDMQLFRHFALIAARLSNSEGLKKWQKKIVELTYLLIKKHIAKKR